MTYPEMREVLSWLIATDGYFSGMDALSDERRHWAVSLHDPAGGRTIQLSDFDVFARNSPHFLSRPRPMPLHFWARDDVQLRLAHVLSILKHVEQAYPSWMTQALFENGRGRYELTLVETQRFPGVHTVRTLSDFERVFHG
jgi:hypothetical protein